jgi:hypothetical protein
MKSRTKTVITLETWRRTTVRIARKKISTDEFAVHESMRDPRDMIEPAGEKIPSCLEPGEEEKHE